jgi:hypothetical protein
MVFKTSPKDYNKVPVNSRISEDIFDIMNNAIEVLKIDKRQFLEIAILNFIEKIDINNNSYNGFDFVTYSKIRKNRMIRQMQNIYRTEILSESTFMLRVEEELLTLFLANSSFEQIKRLLLAKKLESKYYDNSESIIKQIDYYYNLPEKDYKKTIMMLRQKMSENEEYQKQQKYIVQNIDSDKKRLGGNDGR